MQVRYIKPKDVAQRLSELGLNEQVLLGAVQRGLFGWLSCTENHPPSFPGMVAWGEANCALRENLASLGGRAVNDRNLPLTVIDSTGLAFTVSSGDEATGIQELNPKTRNPKGSTTAEKVEANSRQMELFPGQRFLNQEEERTPTWSTWMLLVYRDRLKREVRCELSRPIAVGEDGRVDEWAERIILSTTSWGGEDISLANGDQGGDDGAIDVPVRLKG